jgi:hypothetical protein
MRYCIDLKSTRHQAGRLESRKLRTNKQEGPIHTHQMTSSGSYLKQVRFASSKGEIWSVMIRHRGKRDGARLDQTCGTRKGSSAVASVVPVVASIFSLEAGEGNI